MRVEMRQEITKRLEKKGSFHGRGWKAEVKDGLVYVTQYTGDKKKSTKKRMTWDTFTHLFLLNK